MTNTTGSPKKYLAHVRQNEDGSVAHHLEDLQNMRNFFLVYRDRSSQICQMTSGKWTAGFSEKRQTASGKSGSSTPSVPGPPAQFTQPFTLGWSQYVFLLGIDDADERAFYEIESARNSWTLPELKRQFNASLYERLALSRDKRGIRKLAQHGQIVGRPQDLLKEPYVLEFLGLDEKTIEGTIAAEARRMGRGAGGETVKSDGPCTRRGRLRW